MAFSTNVSMIPTNYSWLFAVIIGTHENVKSLGKLYESNGILKFLANLVRFFIPIRFSY